MDASLDLFFIALPFHRHIFDVLLPTFGLVLFREFPQASS